MSFQSASVSVFFSFNDSLPFLMGNFLIISLHYSLVAYLHMPVI